MQNYANCKNCPHKGVADVLKQFYTLKSNYTIFKNCFETFKDEEKKVFCFGETRLIDWNKVCEDWKKENKIYAS